MNRRDFAKTAGMGVLAIQPSPGFALNEFLKNKPSESAGIPLGLCNHSLRSLQLNARQLIGYAIDKKFDSILLNTFQPLDNFEPGYLSGLSEMAKSNDVTIFIGAGSISEKSGSYSSKYGNATELLTKGIRVASALGSPIVGVRIGSAEDRYMDGGIEAHIHSVIKVMKSVRSEILDSGLKFAFENHAGDLRSEELLALINEAGIDICGALFDPANAVWAMEDPMDALRILGPTIVCTSIRDVAVWETDEGAAFQGMAIGEGMVDFPGYAKTMAQLCPGVPLHVETISNSVRPVPFLRPEFWKGFPDLPVGKIVGFLNMAKKGKPVEIINAPAGMNQKEFDIKLQQSELLKSTEYLRKNCNVGLSP